MSQKPYRILIVDDEKDICELIKTKFQIFGFETFLAHDGKEGFQKALSVKPDCILLDVRMSGEDGLTFLRKLRAFRDDDAETQAAIRKTPVIVLTASGDAMKPLFEMAGVEGYIKKPFDFDHLHESINRVIIR